MKPVLFCFVLWLAVCLAQAQSWTNRYNGPANHTDSASDIALDSGGNVFVTGNSDNSGVNTNYDFLTIKYSNSGVPVWTNRYAARNPYFNSSSLAVEASNNVCVAGTSFNGTNFDFTTIKYSSAGVPLWTNRYNGPGNGDDFMRAKAAADGGGNVYVAGRSTGTDGFIHFASIAYSGTGSPLWTNRYEVSGSYGDNATAVAVDNNSNVFVTGYSQGSGPLDSYDFATIKYSGAGAPLWTNRYNGSGDDEALAIAVDTNGNVYVTGYSALQQTNFYYATIKYSGAGTPLWTNRFKTSGNGFGAAWAIAIDRSGGNVYVTGYLPNTNGTSDYETVAYSSAGVPLWTNSYNGPGDGGDQANAIAVGSSGNVYVTGYSYGGASLGDFGTIVYSSAGTPLGTNIYNGPGSGNDGARSIAVSGDDIFVTGPSDGGSSGADYATIKYAASGNAAPFSFQTTGGSFGFSNGLFGFKLSGPTGSNVVIQASTNLLNWNSVQTNNLGGGPLNFSDPQSATNSKRYYRAILLP